MTIIQPIKNIIIHSIVFSLSIVILAKAGIQAVLNYINTLFHQFLLWISALKGMTVRLMAPSFFTTSSLRPTVSSWCLTPGSHADFLGSIP